MHPHPSVVIFSCLTFIGVRQTWVLSQKIKLVEKIAVSIGSGSIGFIMGFLALGCVVGAIAGHEDGWPGWCNYKKWVVWTRWTFGFIVAALGIGFPQLIELPGSIHTAFFWLGAFILGIALSCLLISLPHLVGKKLW